IEVRGPKNHFALEDGPRYLFIAGGIGITPMLPMLASAAKAGRPFTMLYGGRSLPAMAYRDRLDEYGEAVTVVPEDQQGLPEVDAVIGMADPGTLVYCCGPEPLLRTVENLCVERPDL